MGFATTDTVVWVSDDTTATWGTPLEYDDARVQLDAALEQAVELVLAERAARALAERDRVRTRRRGPPLLEVPGRYAHPTRPRR